MARVSRRLRRRNVEGSAPSPELYLPGQSPLEQLPLEILQTILLESKNENFVTTSTTIWASLGYKPSKWLYNQFLKRKFRTSSHPALPVVSRAHLCRALQWRGFTMEMYIDWINSHEPLDLNIGQTHRYGGFSSLTPYLPKRWITPDNESAIIMLLRSNLLYILETTDSVSKAFARWTYVIEYYANPEATHAWPLALLDLFLLPPNWHGRLCHVAVERSDISFEVLSKLLHDRYDQLHHVFGEIIFLSEKREVIEWALAQGLAPSAKTLEKMCPKPNLT